MNQTKEDKMTKSRSRNQCKMREIERFIQTVKKYPCIWDVNVAPNESQEVKDAVWREIADNFDSIPDAEAAQDKWRSVKNAFREVLGKRRHELASGNMIQLCRHHSYQHVLEFLVPILEHEDGKEGEEEQTSSNENMANVESGASGLSESEPITCLHMAPEFQGIWVNNPCPPTSHKGSTSERGENNDLDAIDRFFLSLAESVKKLPDPLQLKVKRKVFDDVAGAEEEVLTNKEEKREEESSVIIEETEDAEETVDTDSKTYIS